MVNFIVNFQVLETMMISLYWDQRHKTKNSVYLKDLN